MHEISTRGEIEFVVSDNGVEIPRHLDIPDSKSLGLKLVWIMVEEQLEGRIEMDRDRGTRFTIRFKGGQG